MLKTHIYLNFAGTTEAAFEFYRSVFGGEFSHLQRFGDTPMSEQIPESVHQKIMHIALDLGAVTLMGTDALEVMGQQLVMGNNVHISLSPDSKAEAERIFTALSVGGKIEMPLQDTFWGAYFASFGDQFGVQWMINYEYPKSEGQA